MPKSTGPFKHSANHGFEEPNLIYSRLGLDSVFSDHEVTFHEPSLYETRRDPPTARSQQGDTYESWLNTRYAEYTDNLFYFRKSKLKQSIKPQFKKRYSDVLRDPAHAALFYNIWLQLNGRNSGRKSYVREVDKRFFLIQGGMGSGKTTMIRQFANYAFPAALKIEYDQLNPMTFVIDLQEGVSVTEDPPQLYD